MEFDGLSFEVPEGFVATESTCSLMGPPMLVGAEGSEYSVRPNLVILRNKVEEKQKARRIADKVVEELRREVPELVISSEPFVFADKRKGMLLSYLLVADQGLPIQIFQTIRVDKGVTSTSTLTLRAQDAQGMEERKRYMSYLASVVPKTEPPKLLTEGEKVTEEEVVSQEGETKQEGGKMRKGLVDLHRHLDGSLRLETLRELGDKFGVEIPEDVRFFQGMGLEAALERFALTLSVLRHPDEVKRVASEICEDAAADGVTTLEIRFAPQLHVGAEMEEILDAMLEGVGGRAGVILCGLYGEHPSLLGRLVALAQDRPGVVGLDLAGGPTPQHDWSMQDYGDVFLRARECGLGSTVHAGEGRPPGEIRTAIELLHAQRIGHGTTLLEDPSVLSLVLERGVTIEACVTSNMQVGAIPSVEAHPIATWLTEGVRVCICTDNTLFSDVSSTQEIERVAGLPGMTPALVEKAIAYGHEAAFRRA